MGVELLPPGSILKLAAAGYYGSVPHDSIGTAFGSNYHTQLLRHDEALEAGSSTACDGPLTYDAQSSTNAYASPELAAKLPPVLSGSVHDEVAANRPLPTTRDSFGALQSHLNDLTEVAANKPLPARDTFGTLQSHLNYLRDEDPARVFIARKISGLGLQSHEVLAKHYSQYGQVLRVLAVCSKVRPFRGMGARPRIRPGSLAFVIMAEPEKVETILSTGAVQVVAGLQIRVERYQQMPVAESEQNRSTSRRPEEVSGSVSVCSDSLDAPVEPLDSVSFYTRHARGTDGNGIGTSSAGSAGSSGSVVGKVRCTTRGSTGSQGRTGSSGSSGSGAGDATRGNASGKNGPGAVTTCETTAVGSTGSSGSSGSIGLEPGMVTANALPSDNLRSASFLGDLHPDILGLGGLGPVGLAPVGLGQGGFSSSSLPLGMGAGGLGQGQSGRRWPKNTGPSPGGENGSGYVFGQGQGQAQGLGAGGLGPSGLGPGGLGPSGLERHGDRAPLGLGEVPGTWAPMSPGSGFGLGPRGLNVNPVSLDPSGLSLSCMGSGDIQDPNEYMLQFCVGALGDGSLGSGGGCGLGNSGERPSEVPRNLDLGSRDLGVTDRQAAQTGSFGGVDPQAMVHRMADSLNADEFHPFMWLAMELSKLSQVVAGLAHLDVRPGIAGDQCAELALLAHAARQQIEMLMERYQHQLAAGLFLAQEATRKQLCQATDLVILLCTYLQQILASGQASATTKEKDPDASAVGSMPSMFGGSDCSNSTHQKSQQRRGTTGSATFCSDSASQAASTVPPVTTSGTGSLQQSMGNWCNLERGSTLGSHLTELKSEDPRRVFIVRRIGSMGFFSQDLLAKHYSQYGEVRSVRVAHSKVKPFSCRGSTQRVRPGSLGFIVMSKTSAVEKILSIGRDQVVAGHHIQVFVFERSTNEGTSTSTSAGGSGVTRDSGSSINSNSACTGDGSGSGSGSKSRGSNGLESESSCSGPGSSSERDLRDKGLTDSQPGESPDGSDAGSACSARNVE
eukprot:CAMPEP_0170593014 /NCGR_PEP_ID=MMETSP0224-20130122/13221_1 /TAXON_ID=285029 /ORGANISM="Togula jolla, Strain CCCM 725" /LENGTH=1013 /DNA_ID=CAMNT_0010916937 /DNA_START=77 /DNA_END=3118 /DNA_ORIENTATION=-